MAPIFTGGRMGFGRVDPTPSGAVLSPISATGGTKTTSGLYTIHTFTTVGPQTFQVTSGSNNVEYLVIGGGGGGGGYRGGVDFGYGGGAGGYRTNVSGETPGGPGASTEPSYLVVPGTYTVVVGSGGNGAPGPSAGSPGTYSQFGTIVSQGGGGGGGAISGGSNGGSGGGKSGIGNRGDGTNQPTATSVPNQGYSGPGGGGGGAGGDGGTGSLGVPGGPGLPSSITGSPVVRGVGGRFALSGAGPEPAPSGANNTGNGGAGGGWAGLGGDATGGNGGPGVVIIRYLT